MKQIVVRQWFLIVLALTLLVGFTQAQALQPLVQLPALRNGIVAVVLFLMSFPLGFGAMWRALRRPWAALVAVGVNFGLLPLGTWALYPIALQILPTDLAIGICIAAATPSTMASGAVWTRRAGGNDSVAILVTIITNLSCFVVTPLWLLAMTGQEVKSLDFRDMVVKLLSLVVIPIVLAQLLRLYNPIADWATRQKTPMGVAAQFGVLTMVLLGSISGGLKIGGQSAGHTAALWHFALMIAVVLAIHLLMLWAGHVIAWMLGIAREERIAVGFSGSQKTLMVGLAVALDDYQAFPLAVLPMVAYHVGQLLVDTVIADRLRQAGPPDAPA